jgi:hypothetical protein
VQTLSAPELVLRALLLQDGAQHLELEPKPIGDPHLCTPTAYLYATARY